MADIYILEKDGRLEHVRAEKKRLKKISEGWIELARIHGFNMTVQLGDGSLDSRLREIVGEIVRDSDTKPSEEWIEESVNKLRAYVVNEVKERLNGEGR